MPVHVDGYRVRWILANQASKQTLRGLERVVVVIGRAVGDIDQDVSLATIRDGTVIYRVRGG